MAPVKRRRRALLLAIMAVAAAVLAAAIAQGYGTSVAQRFGPLRPVVVARAPLAAERTIDLGDLEAALKVRRVPTRFIPSGALARPREALGLQPRVVIGPGSYVTAALLRAPRSPKRPADRRLGPGIRPVQIVVNGAGALLAAGDERGTRSVDVVVTSEPTTTGPGRTYVVAAAVPLLGLELTAPSPGPGSSAAATLGLTRRQALELIEAESFAREVRLLGRGR